MNTRLRTPSTDHQSRRPPHHKKCMRTANCFISRHSGTDLLGNPLSSRTIRMHLAERHLGSRCLLRVLLFAPTHRRLHFEWCRARRNSAATEWNQVGFSDESRFNLSSDDNHVRVWIPLGERLNPAFILQRYTAPTTDVMLWGVIALITRSPLVLTHGIKTAQWYVHDILQPYVLSLMQRLPGAIFQEDNDLPSTKRVSQDCLPVTTLPWLARSPYLSPIEHVWDHLGRRVGHPTSVNDIEAKLQQVLNKCLKTSYRTCRPEWPILSHRAFVLGGAQQARISKAKRRKRVTRDMSTLKNSMLELAAKFDDNYNTGLIKSFMFGLNKTEIKTMTDILSRYKFRDSHAENFIFVNAKRRVSSMRNLSRQFRGNGSTIKHSKYCSATSTNASSSKIKIPAVFDEEIAEYQGLSKTAYTIHENKLMSVISKVSELSMQKSASELLVLHPTKNKIVECDISFDGT
ncbi:transposable element Tc1 transposase [Trichonephila clavipes]|nr:transposable element Tc1 transposase [Trichonephila clavipes]